MLALFYFTYFFLCIHVSLVLCLYIDENAKKKLFLA
jgi:hypothetical protein